MLNPRKLAAIDLAFLGPKIIISEFAFAVLFAPTLGVFVLLRGHRSPAQIALGFYLISLGLNYVPMLAYAVAINEAKSARTELGKELDDKRAAISKYRRQSTWLLMPLVVPIIALMQRRKPVTAVDC